MPRPLRSNFEPGSPREAVRRAQWKALGLSDADMLKPKIAVVNSSSVGSGPEVVRHGETGLLVNNNTPKEWYEALAWILENRHRWPAMGTAARKHVSAASKACAYEASPKNSSWLARGTPKRTPRSDACVASGADVCGGWNSRA